jgi:outer membrane protein assembly factor BamB
VRAWAVVVCVMVGCAGHGGVPIASSTAIPTTIPLPTATAAAAVIPTVRPEPRRAPPLLTTADPASLAHLRHELYLGTGELPPPLRSQAFPDTYTDVPGVLTFRGGPARTGGAFGARRVTERRLEVAWTFKTTAGTARWGGGAGWTGEPVLVRWPDVVRHSMAALGARRTDRRLVEVIQGSLDGNVYFLDLRTGKPTRAPLRTGNPIKGSVSLDPRGWPLLFVGQGIPGNRPIGLRIYSLVDGEEVFFLPGRDPAARRAWGAFDSCGLLNRDTDTYLVGGENGIVYLLELHSAFDPIALTVKVAPRVLRYRFREEGEPREGIENSLAVLRNLAFFADNSGTVQALDLATFRPAWAFDAGDDTDASLVVEEEPSGPVLYTASEVDHQGERGFARLRKLDALTGKPLWTHEVPCRADHTSAHTTDAGVFATPVVGKDDLADRVVFTLSRCPERGAVLALAKADGRELWRRGLATDAWSSPTEVRDEAAGKTWLLQADRGGRLHLLDPADGRIAFTLPLDGTVEASPAVYDDLAVVGTRAGTIYGIRIR